jgi:hypothetical protein
MYNSNTRIYAKNRLYNNQMILYGKQSDPSVPPVHPRWLIRIFHTAAYIYINGENDIMPEKEWEHG